MKCFFPIDKIMQGSKVAIWGAGELGRELYKWNQQFRYCDIVCFFDQKIEAVYDIPAYKIDKLVDIKIDYLIVTIVNQLDSIKAQLKELKVVENNCVFIAEGYLDENYYGKDSFSQMGEDVIVASLLRMLKRNKITYCDIGANDPIRLSNTYLLEKKFNIEKGVLIEPNPVLFEKLKAVRKSNICLNIGICGKEQRKQKLLKFYVMDQAVLSTFSTESVVKYQRWGHEIEREIMIECLGVNSVFEKYFGDGRIDFLNIDIEGTDFEVVSGIDFEKYHPVIICVETNGYQMGKDEDGIQIIDFLIEKGYIVYADTLINTIFVLKAEIEKYYKNMKTIKG